MFFLEVWGMRKRRRRQVAGERNYPNNVCTYEYMNKRKNLKTEQPYYPAIPLLSI
jgi:hypothetical protein